MVLTRAGCTRTPLLKARLAEALQRLGAVAAVDVLDLDGLPAADARGGYGTPTILVAGRDLFDLPAPTWPWPSPS
ncbi:MAG: hypothetical protein AB7U83_04850 [Vicinamibacterales bacterium]